MSETTNTQEATAETTQAHAGKKGAAKTEATAPAVKPVEFKKVIIQRPQGASDSHLFIGFNEFERQVAYDTPVSLPVEVIAHLRRQRVVEHRPDESGKVVPTYANMLSIVDAE